MKLKSLAVQSEDDDGNPCLEYIVVPENVTAEQWLADEDVEVICVCFDMAAAERVAVAWNAYYGPKN